MRVLSFALGLVVLSVASPSVAAEGRVDARTLTCAAIKAIVARDRDVVLASSETAYEAVHNDVGACASDETGAPAFEPSSDEPSCFAGWRCKQRNSDGSQK